MEEKGEGTGGRISVRKAGNGRKRVCLCVCVRVCVTSVCVGEEDVVLAELRLLV